MAVAKKSLELRKKYRGLVGVHGKVPIKDNYVPSLVYTPGVVSGCLAIAENSADSFRYAI